MELLFDPGQQANVLRDRATGILSDLLSEVIDRVRSKTGDDMLGVAEALNVNRRNSRLHSLPLKEGVKDVCAALREHAAVSRKRKRTKGSDSDCSPESYGDVLNDGPSFNDNPTSASICDGANNVSDGQSEGSDCETIGSDGTIIGDNSGENEACCVPCPDIVHEKEDTLQPQNPPSTLTPSSDHVPSSKVKEIKSERVAASQKPVRISARKAKLQNIKLEKIKSVESISISSPSLSSSSQTDKKTGKQDSKYKKKRIKDIHKKCNKDYKFKLENAILATVPFIVEDNELTTLIQSECPKKWAAGEPRTPLFKRKYFCRRCILGEGK